MWGSHENKNFFFLCICLWINLPLDKFSSNLVFRTERWQIIVTGINSFLFRWISELKVTVSTWLWQELLKYHQRDMATVPIRNVCLKEAIWRSFEEYLFWFFILKTLSAFVCVCVLHVCIHTHTHVVQHLHIISDIKMSIWLFSQLISYSDIQLTPGHLGCWDYENYFWILNPTTP